VVAELERLLQAVFLTDKPVATLTSSGTGAMEAAVVNLFSPGDRVLVPVSGKFSGRWVEICRAFGIEACRMEIEPGDSPGVDAVVDLLEGDTGLAGVLLTHCETSTGALTDVGAVSRAVAETGRCRGERLVTCVDCITSLCIDEFRMDDWCVDCAIGASQKGFLSPPGLAFVSVDPGLLDRGSAGSCYYFDLKRYFDHATGVPFTPAVSLVRAVRASLEAIVGLGLPAIWRASRASAAAILRIVEAAGFKPVARFSGGAVVAFWVGELDAHRFAEALRVDHGIVVAQGQRDLRGRILRVSPIGKGPEEILEFAAALAKVQGDMGKSFPLDAVETELKHTLEDCRIWESLQ
jgi:aspartate aminotransferase-like enzyme